MKQYKIKNTDLMLNGKLFPEGSTINLDDKDAQSLSNYLDEIKDNVTLNLSSQDRHTERVILSGVEGLSARDEVSSNKNIEQKTNIKTRKK